MNHDAKLLLLLVVIAVIGLVVGTNADTTPFYVNSPYNPLYGFIPSSPLNPEEPVQNEIVVRIIPSAILWFSVAIFMAAWIYKDATERGNKNPFFWTLLTIFFGIATIIVWFFLRTKSSRVF